ncbi:MAG: hypothetical protein DRN04_18395 [Thermoprotei archaeon]|nr:MAG: hypothetical protein DRN04_18395 [Thermoprotei archaeon]
MVKVIIAGVPPKNIVYIKFTTIISFLVVLLALTYGQKLFYDLLCVLVFLIPLLTMNFIKSVKASKAVKKFLKDCIISDKELKLKREYRVKWGVLETLGHRTLSGLYSHDTFFIPNSNTIRLRKVELNNVDGDFCIVISKMGTGAALLSGFKIFEGECKGVTVVFVKPQNIAYKPVEDGIILKYREYVVEASIKPCRGGFQGSVYVYEGDKKLYVKLILNCMIKVENSVFKNKIVLVRPKNFLEKFNYNADINETYIIVTYEKNISPIALAKKLKLKLPLIAGNVKGKLTLELTMKIPFRKKLTKRTAVKIIKLKTLTSEYSYIL